MLICTSGTTSQPKGVLDSSRTLLAEVAADIDGFLLISSVAVEDLLHGHSAIAEAAAIAAPYLRMVELFCACVGLKAGATVSLDDLRAYLAAAGIARQKTPEGSC